MKQHFLSFAALASAGLLQGCVGYNSAVFATKTNVGIDADTKPPTAEISIARREAVLAPTFEDGKTPPVSASFRVDSGFWIFADISSTFSGGDAAATMASLYDADTVAFTSPLVVTNAFDSTLLLRREPVGKFLGKPIRLPQNTIRPFLFGTDTSLGLKLGWSGMTAAMPDTVKLGFNRKEFAFAPINGREMAPTNINGETYSYAVKMPSFLATVDTQTKMKAPNESGAKLIQYFATGLAADRLSLQSAVRQAMAERSDPQAYKLSPRAQALISTNDANLHAVVNGVSDGGNPPKVDANKLAKALQNGVMASSETNSYVTTWTGRSLPEFEQSLRTPAFFGKRLTVMKNNLQQ